jgi:hypothetical protein
MDSFKMRLQETFLAEFSMNNIGNSITIHVFKEKQSTAARIGEETNYGPLRTIMLELHYS